METHYIYTVQGEVLQLLPLPLPEIEQFPGMLFHSVIFRDVFLYVGLPIMLIHFI